MGFSKTGVAQSLGSVQVSIDSEAPKPTNPKDSKDSAAAPAKPAPK